MIERQEEKPPFVWVKGVGRYRDTATGRFVKTDRVLDLVRQSIMASNVAADQLATYVAQGGLGASDWVMLFRQEIKEEYIRNYLLGIGGRNSMTKSDWGKVGSMLKQQYKYLDGFANEVKEGTLTEKQVSARSDMYINSARNAFETAQAKVVKKLGFDEEAWVLGDAEHCDDCIVYSGQGWKPIGSFPMPGDGSTACLTNCQCHKTYRKSASEELYGSAKS